MANVYDQFDAPPQQGGGNPYDQFDVAGNADMGGKDFGVSGGWGNGPSQLSPLETALLMGNPVGMAALGPAVASGEPRNLAGIKDAYTSAAAGVPEGFKQVYRGTKQLGGDLEDAWRTFMYGMPSRDAKGQPLPTSAGYKATVEGAAAHDLDLLQAQEQGRNMTAYGAGSNASEFGTLGLLSEAPGAAAAGLDLGLGAGEQAGALGLGSTTFTGNAARQIAGGATGGALAFSPTNDKGTNIALGAGLGLAMSPLAAYAAARNVVARTMADSEAAGSTRASLQGAQELMGPGWQPTMAMQTGSPIARTYEAQAFNGPLQARYKQLIDTAIGKFQAIFQSPIDQSANLSSSFQDTVTKATNGLRSLQKAASDSYDAGMAKAADLASNVQHAAGPVPPREPMTFTQGGVPETVGTTPELVNQPTGAQVPVSNFLAQLNVLRSKAANAGSMGFSADLKGRLLSGLYQTANKGWVSPKDLATMLRGLTSEARNAPAGSPARAAIGQLRDALDHDLDLVADKQGVATDQSVQQILATRAQYRAAKQQIDALRQTATFKLLGIGPNVQKVEPQDLVSRFESFTPAKQAEIRQFLEQNNPQMLTALKDQVARNAVAQATKLTAASNSKYDVQAFYDALFKDGELRTSGLWKGQERVDMMRIKDALRVLSNVSMKQVGGVGTITQPAEYAQNLVSRSAIFSTRLLVRALNSVHGSKIFTDPQFLKDLQTIRATSGPAQLAARMTVLHYLENYGQKQAQSGAE